MSTVAQLLARGSGPARVRARLREQTRALNRTALRLSAEQAQSARLVDAPLPESVLGGELLGMLSGPLQALLRVDARDPAAGEPAPGARPRFDAPATQRKHGRAHQAGGSADRGSHRAGAGGPNGHGKKGRDLEVMRKPVSQSEQGSGASGPGALWPAPDRPGSADGIAAGDERVTRAKWGDGASRAKRPTAATLLAREVDEYFQAALAGASQPAPMASESSPALPVDAPAARTVPRPDGLIASPAGGLAGRGWTALNGQQVAERLNAFVAGGLPLETAREDGAPAGGRRLEINNTFNIQVGPAEGGDTSDGEASLEDLSDRVAEILRQQAIQHGIDVT